ncbi:MAG TPA: hypothetical protein VNT01_03165 [Symbiobacteriaceae bacterium]|nr:hypothetical protein [Symbiobacteriaceae bacterium]
MRVLALISQVALDRLRTGLDRGLGLKFLQSQPGVVNPLDNTCER